MWFIVLIVSIHGHDYPMDRLAETRFPSRTACMADALGRASSIAAAGAHGRFLCMREGESDAALARERKVSF